jgi:VanZ family protein
MLAVFWLPPPPDPQWDWAWLDETVHAGSFFGWAGLARVAAFPVRATLAFGVGLAVITELVQATLPWDRSADPSDVLADVVGLALGLGVARLLGIPRRR